MERRRPPVDDISDLRRFGVLAATQFLLARLGDVGPVL
jgi:hypothetical protein